MTPDSSPDRALEEAMDWLLRMNAAPEDESVQAGLAAWLAADPRHVRAWARAQQTWDLLGEAAPEKTPIRLPMPGDRLLPAQRRSRRPLRIALGMALAASVLAFAVLPSPSLWQHIQADTVTARGETRTVTLADGTQVHLAPQSAIAAHFSSDRRAVTLLAGEAFFEVQPDATRPFTVTADALDVTVVGTAFDLRVDTAEIAVGVAHGIVAVDGPSGALGRLTAGDALRLDRASGAVTRDHAAPDTIAAWRDGRLFVDKATVAEVVAALRRYHSAWIVIADDALAAREVTGFYDLADPDRALRALVQPAGGEVQEATPLLRILTLP